MKIQFSLDDSFKREKLSAYSVEKATLQKSWARLFGDESKRSNAFTNK